VVVLAGCTGGGTPTPAADAAGNGDGGAGTDGSVATSTPTATPAETAPSTPTPTPAETAPSTPTPTRTPNATDGTATPEPLPRMSELLELESNYRFRAEYQVEGGTEVHEGRVYGSDFVTEVTHPQQGGPFTLYYVDGRQAAVMDGQCFSQNVPDLGFSGNWTDADYVKNISVRPSRTTTIDNRTVYVYEADRGYPRPDVDGPFEYYVTVETGRLLRMESASATIEMSDWGHDEPVELPC
jgi:hypothetical protein